MASPQQIALIFKYSRSRVMNGMQLLLEFIAKLKEAKIHFMLGCERDAVMVSIVSPATYYEIEFFADGEIEVQTWGPAGAVRETTLPEITETILQALHGSHDRDEAKH
jgi:hypothetical protein